MAVAFSRTATDTSSTVASVRSVSLDVGTAAGDRSIVVSVASDSSVPQSVTVAGRVTGATTLTTFAAQSAAIFYCGLPTSVSSSTAVTIAVTFSGDVASGAQEIVVYKLTGASTTLNTSGGNTSTDMDASTPLTTPSLSVTAGNLLFLIASGSADTSTHTAGNATIDLSADSGAFRTVTATRTTTAAAAATVQSTVNGSDGAMSYAVFAAGSPNSDSILSAAGIGAASGVSAATKTAAGASAGVGAAPGISAATKTADGAAAGVGSAPGISAAAKTAAGASAGVGTASGVSAAAKAAVAAASGTSPSTAVGDFTSAAQLKVTWAELRGIEGAANTEAVAESAGVGTAAAISAAAKTADAASAGVGTVSGISAASKAADANSAGTSTANAVGASSDAAVASSAGVGTAAAVSSASKTAVASSAGAATVDGVGLSSSSAQLKVTWTELRGIETTASGAAVASSAGASTALGVSAATKTAVANAAGAATADAVGSYTITGTVDAVANSDGTSTANAVGVDATPAVTVPVGGLGVIMRKPGGPYPSRKKLLELYEAWREAKVKAEEGKNNKGKRLLKVAVKALAPIVDDAAELEAAQVAVLTRVLKAAAQAKTLAGTLHAAEDVLAQAHAYSMAMDDDDEEAILILAA